MSHDDAAAHVEEDTATVTPLVVKQRGPLKRSLGRVPLFAYMFALYVVIELSVSNVRAVLFAFGGYSLTWVEVMYMVAFTMAIFELLRVSHPGIDNIREALLILAAGVVYIIVFALGAAQVTGMGIFSNTEFLMLVYFSSVQVCMAFILNARTLKRTIDHGGG